MQRFITDRVFAGHETTKNQPGWMIGARGASRRADAVAAGAEPPESVAR